MSNRQPPKTPRSKQPASFYAEMEQLLRRQIEAQPDNQDLRVRLLELYWEAERETDFLREAQVFRNALRGNLDSPDWRLIASIGRALAPDSPLFNDAAADKTSSPPREYRRLGEREEDRRHFEALARDYQSLRGDPAFLAALDRELIELAGRPTSLFLAERLSAHVGGARIYCKREDFAVAGSHLLMAIVGQALAAKRMGRKTLVTGTVYGQKGVMTAAIAARLGMKAVIYMDGTDIHAQAGNVFRMWLSGAMVESIDAKRLYSGDVREAAVRHWSREPDESFLVLGLDAAPEPYPSICQDAVASIGRECRRQVSTLSKRAPDVLVARGRNSSDAIGLFPPFIDSQARLVCVDSNSSLVASSAANPEADVWNEPSAPLTEQQQRIAEAILEGLEYPSVAREHRWLRQTKRVEYVGIGMDQAKQAILDFSRLEGIVPAIQGAHSIAWACQAARTLKPEQVVVVFLSERSDKDIWDIGKALGIPL